MASLSRTSWYVVKRVHDRGLCEGSLCSAVTSSPQDLANLGCLRTARRVLGVR
jgi:hypothetical protein